MQNQFELVDYLISLKALQNKNLINAFYKIDRADFVPSSHKEEAYNDYALPLGYGQTISQPRVVAFMLELLEPKLNEKILEIGCGSGWVVALLAECIKPIGTITGVEIIKELKLFGQKNLAKYHFTNAKIIQAREEVLGLPEQPFDKILVSAAANSLPIDLVAQFTTRLVIPIKNSIWLIEKENSGKLHREEYYGFSFVPLT